MARKKIGEILVDHGVISQKSLNQALLKQKDTYKPIGKILEEIGVVSEEDIAQGISKQFNIPYFKKISDQAITKDVLNKFDYENTLNKMVFPLREDQNTIYLAMANPLDIAFQDELSFRFDKRISPFVTTPTEIQRAIKRNYLSPTDKALKNQDYAVLHIDSQELILNTAGNVLEKDGFCVHKVKTGEEGLRVAVQVKPQLIITDIQLPRIDGKALFRALRINGETATIPVIAMSSDASAEDESQLLEMGFFDFVAKPFNPTRFLARVRRAMRHCHPADGITV